MKGSICFITSTLTSGGSERVMSILANELSNRDYSVEIIHLQKHVVFYPLNRKVYLSFAEDEVGHSYYKRMIWLRNHIHGRKPDIIIAGKKILPTSPGSTTKKTSVNR